MAPIIANAGRIAEIQIIIILLSVLLFDSSHVIEKKTICPIKKGEFAWQLLLGYSIKTEVFFILEQLVIELMKLIS